MKIVWMLIALVVIFGAYCLIEIRRELKDFRVTTYQVLSPGLNKMTGTGRIIFLSDLHNRVYGKDNEKLWKKIVENNPDLILIGGDMLVRKDGTSYEETLHFLRRLPEICPVYYANGNHEQKLKEKPECYKQSYKTYKRELEKAGIHMLENASVTVMLKGQKLTLTGLEIPLWAYARLGKKALPEEEITERIGKPDGNYQVLLAHHPGYIKEYVHWGADLILSGHYHGCVVQLPEIGGVIAPDFTLFPKYSGGIYHEKDSTVVVSRGLGTHSVPIRLWNWPELIVLELKSS